MYNVFGWVFLSDSPSEIDEGNHDLECQKLKEYIEKLTWSNPPRIFPSNGFYIVTVHMIINRRRSEAEELDLLLKYIVEHFKGAYGIVYEYDNYIEVPAGRGVYSVKVLKRGRIEVALDPFLSPVCPVVEDTYKEE